MASLISGRLRVLLGVSLALNLLVIAAVGTMALRHAGHHSDHRGHGGRGGGGGGALTRALDPEDRRIIAEKMRETMGDGQAMKAARAARNASLLAALRADPYDAQAVAQILQDKRAAMVARIEMGQEFLQERLRMMSAPDRAAFADRLEAAMAQHWKGHKKGHD